MKETGTTNPEIERARELARAAGALVTALRDKGMEELAVEHKPGDEPVTVADRAANELIVSGLRKAFPTDVIVSEESAAHDRARLTAERVWYVDPIDGTKDFIRGEDGFSVMIGLCLAARPVMGVVYQPTRDRMYWTTGEGGAWMTEGGGEARRLHVSEVADEGAIRMVASRSNRGPALERVKTALHIKDELAIGSVGLKLGLIALGERDLYVNPWPKCKAWDTCAPEAILVAAGGVLTDTAGGAIRYDEEDLRRRKGLVASNGRLHAAVLARLAHLLPATGN
ncbi:MAG: 3'(2'),5'-bisphosphate nucleotidase CysQ [Kofleriaceae bacterium]|nr:MAG: 3'(2'),5'-bisphosphate nucleotidase CysQ [Kofleriaceae bacterium]MBZ0237489.1 3'(2'),5'-bisphosphate nucleotidase CysQ [Kofleriaceae bacterium]